MKMSYNDYANMPTHLKDRMVEGTDLREKILNFNSEKEESYKVCTPKWHHSGQQRISNEYNQIILSNDEDDFQIISHERKKVLTR